MGEPHPNSVSPGEAQSVGQRAPAGSSLSFVCTFLTSLGLGRAALWGGRQRAREAAAGAGLSGFNPDFQPVPPPRVPRPLRPGTGSLDELSSPQGQGRNATSEQARSSQDLNSTKQPWSENLDPAAVFRRPGRGGASGERPGRGAPIAS